MGECAHKVVEQLGDLNRQSLLDKVGVYVLYVLLYSLEGKHSVLGTTGIVPVDLYAQFVDPLEELLLLCHIFDEVLQTRKV